MSRPSLLSVCVFLCLAIPATGHAAEKMRLPNIVFILVDDLGYADLGCYGCKDIKTPNIDRLAKEGVKFSDFYANAPVCSPTRCAFMTGRWQQRVGFEWALGYTAEQVRNTRLGWVVEKDFHSLGMPTKEVTIASLLKSSGYATGCFGKWHLGSQPKYLPTKRGFDEYFGTLLGHADYFAYNYFDGTYQLHDGEKQVKAKGYLTDLINRRAVEFIRKHKEKPFFLYVPDLAVHAPYQPPDRPKPSVTKDNMHDGDRKTYAAMLGVVDQGVGAILAELQRQKLSEDTLVVLAGDNGGAPHFSDNSPLFNHKQTLWEGGIRVPCLMRYPGKLPKGKVVKQPAITMDLSATFLALAGAKPARDRPLDGIDLMPILLGKQAETTRTFFWRIDRSNRKQKAVRHADWKYVNDAGYIDLLFDLSKDIGERKNLAFRNPKVVRDLKAKLAAWEKDVDGHHKEHIIR